MTLRVSHLAVAVVALTALATGAHAQATAPDVAGVGTRNLGSFEDTKKTPKGAEIVTRIGAQVPVDAPLTRHDGERVTLGDYFASGVDADGDVTDGKPVLLLLGYYECPMLCSLVLNAAFEGVAQSGLAPGRDFNIVAVSIDPDEPLKLAADKRANHLKALNIPGADAGVFFHTTDAASARRIADAVGFGYVKDESTGEFAHGAGIFFVSPKGVLTRTLYGATFPGVDVKRALMEASSGTLGTVIDRIVMSCFRYYSDNQKYGVYVMGVMRLGGVITMVALGSLLLLLWRRERVKKSPTSAP